MTHLDTSALAKLLVEEPESGALRTHLTAGGNAGTQFAISTIATVELRRLAIRLDLEAARVEPVLRPFHVLRLTEGILALAGRLSFPHLGTLDAIHVATALTAEADTLLTYDARQAEAAAAEGLTILSPT